MKFTGASALVLHVRPYRESSALVQFFTRPHGRLTGVYKGIRRRKATALQPFCLGELSCVGGSGLLTVAGFEEQGRFTLMGDALASGFYVLELLARVMPERQAEQAVFDAAIDALSELQSSSRLAPALRNFEQQLLTGLGFAIDLLHDFSTGSAVEAELEYEWVADQGVRRARGEGIPGHVLLSMAAQDYDDAEVQRYARLLHRQALTPLLGDRPLMSRQLLVGRNLEQNKP